MEERYRKEICSNCANNNCTNNIKIINKANLIMEDQIRTETTIKCEDFISINKRRNKGFKFERKKN